MDKGKTPDIPPRTSSLKKVEAERESHRASQLSLNALADPQYWDLELKIKDCEQETDEIWFADKKRNFSQTEIEEEEQSFARKTRDREQDKEIIRDQRRRISSKIQENEPDLATDLRATQIAYTMIVKKAVFDGFRPGRRDKRVQDTFRKMLIQEHNSINPDDNKQFWCPVMREFFGPLFVKASHIFPYRMGEDVMKQVFGNDSANEMFSARNGLLLYLEIENAFDNYQIVIVPKGLLEDQKWKVRIVDKCLLTQKMTHGCWRDLDNAELIFRGNCRPAARYLYWHYCLAVIHAAENSSRLGWLEEMGTNCWATPGKYIRANMLRALAEQIGHCVPEDLPEPDLPHHIIEDGRVQTVEDQAAAALLVEDSLEERDEE